MLFHVSVSLFFVPTAKNYIRNNLIAEHAPRVVESQTSETFVNLDIMQNNGLILILITLWVLNHYSSFLLLGSRFENATAN